MKERLSRFCYQRRVVLGNLIAFAGFVVVLLDRNASIAPNRLLTGAFVGLLGFSLRIWASSYQWHNISRALPESRTGLITAGPYALMRHPIYVGMILLTAGIFVAFGSWLAVIVAVIPTILLNYWQAHYEDQFLLERHGRSAEAYRKHLWRFFPKFWNPYPIRQGKFSIAQGIKFDIGPLSAFVCFIVFMLVSSAYRKPDLTTTLGALILAVLLSFLFTLLTRRLFDREFSQ
jgi:protein-S-isoprenylcysteine O-methyltransferase Ste14